MTFQRSVRVLAGLCLFGFLGAATVGGQSLAEQAEKAKQRRKKAGKTDAPAPAFSNEDLRKLPDSAEGNPDRSSDDESQDSRTSTASGAEAESEAWWRARARACREGIEEAEQAVKRYEALVEEARTGIRQPQPGDATRQLPPPRVASDAEKRAAEFNLAQARRGLAEAKKETEDLEEEARKKQILPGWLR